ncbi:MULTISPECIES: TonB-dependent receptor [Aliiglaciecola]|uniref:TonB-dependent receptor n=1 Tax=Aliiglaciecola TaxID=1406885 RepID=UPI001C0A3137|nr:MULTISPECIES: TonB-dependent receptor [Aliiglaciecola]MBU2879918.1 TonB-dependent receptor [Aliiglaciecola lipolytica]MDO6712398.1 TonB-dependent receptor [Aliiglaciecola sp. 2_MG-2023]MDO6753392.1 TonB-dependent receptor [Aliiglaciecola sp. 1_MG-2023]
MNTHNKFKKSVLTKSISLLLTSSVIMPTIAQESPPNDGTEVIAVTGIRGSLFNSMNLKRDSEGVVDAISSEDIGKFPSTNLAESLQRIPGVSIDRVNGEGSQVTVRGFGADFNQVTLNGRTMPTANVPIVGAGSSGSASGASGRAFDFSNLSSDGVQILEVFKTGRADISSGGIGATVNVVTRRPLGTAGLQGSISAKAIHDTSVDGGSSITPEIGGSFSWANEDNTFGIGFFGGISNRDSAAAGATSSSWNVIPYSEFLGLTTEDTIITNAPASLDQYVTLPRDSRYQFSEFERERSNGQLVLQFAPSENLSMTADYTFAVNKGVEEKVEFYNWFNRPFTEVVFDDSPVPTTIFIKERAINKGGGMPQVMRATKDELSSFGFNAEYYLNDSVTLTFDGHSSKAEVTPDSPMGYTEINVGLDHKYGNSPTDSAFQSVDYSGAIPVRTVETISGATVIRPEIVASQVASLRKVTQINEIDQYDFRADWVLEDGANLTVGANYRTQKNVADRTDYQQILGNWGSEYPGDVENLAPGSLETFCLSCKFNDHTIGGGTTSVGGATNNEVYAVRGNAADIFAALSPAYEAGYSSASSRPLRVTSSAYDVIEEDVTSIFVQLTNEFQIGGLDAYLNVGLRYEQTDVTATTESSPTSAIIWQGDNDFAKSAAASSSGFSSDSSYSNLLPNIDLAINLTDEVKVRASYSKTLARATYNNLYASDNANSPSGPTALGNVVTGSKGNPGLKPLESDNYDVSVEWYFDETSYVSAGLFSKRVSNFVGRETVNGNLFGLRDASSGAPGTRSGMALEILDNLGVLANEINLFAAAVYVDQSESMAEAMALFMANQDADGNIEDAEYDRLEGSFEIVPNSDDPLFNFALNQPINNNSAEINGLELQAQHFFGESGFGIVGSYTVVNGDVGYDISGAPNVSQFALQGLSDTANVTLIYEKNGWSSRLAYNWRDEFLASANDGSGFNNPVFVEDYGQLDFNLSYSFNDQLAVSFDAINLNEERSRSFSRSKTDLHFIRENAARYYLGVRYKF